ncbi:MAG TPA: AMP-binding protein, partial [Actinomycetota bacterium]|nr:AMP-binding protein [Actinomycetota bacterium]
EQSFPRQPARARLFDEYRARGLWGSKTFNDILEDACTKRWPDSRFVVASRQRPAELTYREMHERGVRLAGALHALGLRKGDVFAMEMPNWMEGCLAYHACAALGVVVVPIIHIYKAKEVEFILRQSRAKVFMVPDTTMGIDYLELVAEVRPKLPDLEHVIVVGDKVPEDCLSFEDVAARETSDFPRPDISPDEPHILAYTSGTTSDPKGVVHSHNTLFSELRAVVAASGGDEHDVFMSPNPIGHIAGIYSALIAPFVCGYKQLLLVDGFDPRWMLELIAEHAVTRSGGAPIFMQVMLNDPGFASIDTSSLQLFGVGGANVSPALIEQADSQGWWSFRSYGCTEHPSITMGTLDDPLEKRAHTDGRAMLDVEIRLVDEDGNDVPAGEPGEIISRGPDQFLGYMDPQMDAEVFTDDGWFRTGDIGIRDQDGYVRITDRKKDIIIRGGENISAREVEEVLNLHPKVQEAAVTPVRDDRYGERVCAFVIANGNEVITLDEVRAHFAEHGVARQKTPERIEIVDAFPRTLSGKVQKYVLRREIES